MHFGMLHERPVPRQVVFYAFDRQSGIQSILRCWLGGREASPCMNTFSLETKEFTLETWRPERTTNTNDPKHELNAPYYRDADALIVCLDSTKALPRKEQTDTYFLSVREISRSKPLTIIIAVTKCDFPRHPDTNRELLTLRFAPEYGISAIVEIATRQPPFNTDKLLRLATTLEPLSYSDEKLPYLQYYIPIPTQRRHPTVTPYLGVLYSEQCKLCHIRERNCTSHPCGHFSLCRTCSATWRRKLCPEPSCNKFVEDITEVFEDVDVPITLKHL